MHRSEPDRRRRSIALDRRTAKGICALVVVVLLGFAVLSALAEDVETDPDLAPLFSLPNLDGDDVALVEYRGNVIILDFWATWCKICTKTFPDLHALGQAYADRGVVLLVVSLDKSAEEARDHLIENEFATDNVLWGSLKAARAVKDLYGVGGIAHAFLIDRAGYIRYSGHPTRLTPEELERWL